MEQQYTPPFTMTDRIIEKISEISELVGRITAWQGMNKSEAAAREQNQDDSFLACHREQLALARPSDCNY